ncbi:RNA-binding (RRM/RBD/RNP motifs) family protein [Zea mays]|uniref:RNA-binding (RRM/RBD/RNP motifs) family protein n=1 Tax=Zea mays TaxID=4577 RepID=A0A1D6F3T9_MAIZE|nr:RNA-binding (RRM/RBD/RNP motifs) family protein [Zea mays]
MADPTERDQFTDDEEEEDYLEDGEQGLGSEDEEGGGAGGKRKRLGNTLGGIGKRGVCYLSRVPPHMNPSHIRQMLSKYGEVLRIYLVPEGQGHHKHTSVKAKAYSEGWIEFAKKSVAKRVANLLNGEQIGS